MRWFRHYTDGYKSEGLTALSSRLGMAAIGRWYTLLELVAEKMDESDRCHIQYPLSWWCDTFDCTPSELLCWLATCEKFCKIEVEVGPELVASYSQVADKLRSSCSHVALKLRSDSRKVAGELLKVSIPNLLNKRDEYSRKSGQTPDKNPPQNQNQNQKQIQTQNQNTNCPVPAIPPVSPQTEPEQGGQGEVVLSSGNGVVKTIGEVLQPIGFQRVHLTPEQKEQAWREKRAADAKLVAESLAKYKAEREAENVKPIPSDEKEAVQWWIDEFAGLIPNATDEIRAKLHARLINIKDKEQIHVIFNDLSLYMQEHHVERPAGLILNRLWNVSKGLS